MFEPRGLALAGLAAAFLGSAGIAAGQDVRHYRFAYDQSHSTGYGIAADIFADKLKALSNGTMLIDQFPGAQLGQEPQVLQLVKSGDVDFAITSSANTATVSPQVGVMLLHFLFRSENHLKKVMADPQVVQALRELLDDTVRGSHAIGLATLGLRSLYGGKAIRRLDDLKGLKVRVQATATEDTMFPAYRAQTVHMPFASVYTSLQTGVVDFAENGVGVYLLSRHYEVAPVLSITEHEANTGVMWISDKLWLSLTLEQRQWVRTAADEVNRLQPDRAFALERESAAKLKSIGVKVVDDVDKSAFLEIAEPYLDQLSKQLGPQAVKIRRLIRALQ